MIGDDMKNRLKIVIAFVLGLVISGIGVYALSASSVTYKNDTTVDEALDYLYTQTGKRKATQVATLTTRGATYTMQNDGYITGSMSSDYRYSGADIKFDGQIVTKVYYLDGDNTTLPVSLFVPKNTIVSTRSDGGTYDLIVYEFTLDE